jgi:hypothetical protein
MKSYTDETRCKVECPQGLACFGIQCQTDFEQYCVEVLYSIKATAKPDIIITALRWIPPANATARCKVYAKSYNDFIVRHEEQHARDIMRVLDEWEKKNDRKYLRRCAPTEAEAQAQIDAAIAADLESAYADLMRMDCDSNVAFHESHAGRSATPRCEMCQ